jgi:curli biogenesis system outer membrane secretion channel CsgG
VHTNQFRVVERSQLNQGLLVEKQLSSQGISDGAPADQKLRAAEYLFEGTISEANPSERQRSGAVGVAGLTVGGGRNKDVLAIDVRVIDARTGDVLDSVTVRKAVKSTSSSVSGVGSLLSEVMAQHGESSPYTPDVSASNAKKDSLDIALRDAIGVAVGQLAAKF